MSYQEVGKYFTNDEARKCALTDYAIENGTYADDDDKADGRPTGWWWLRSPGSSASRAARVHDDGGLGNNGRVYHDFLAVRPALWVNLASGTF